MILLHVLKTIYSKQVVLGMIDQYHSAIDLVYDNIYHEGNISKMLDFDAFSLSDIKERNKQSHGKRKMTILNENIKLYFLFLI